MTEKKPKTKPKDLKNSEELKSSSKNQKPQEKSKLDILKEVVANERKREAEKQKQIYNAMIGFIYERKG